MPPRSMILALTGSLLALSGLLAVGSPPARAESWQDCGTGVFAPIDAGPIQTVAFLMGECPSEPATKPVMVAYKEGSGLRWETLCLSAGVTPVGWAQADPLAPNLEGEYDRGVASMPRSECDEETVPIPPRPGVQEITVTGRFVYERGPSGDQGLSPFAFAEYQFFYFGSDGAGHDEWRPLLDAGGAHVRDFLDGDGSYRETFPYPNLRRNPDGSTARLCPLPADGAVYPGGGHACEARHIQVRLFPRHELDHIRVYDVDQTSIVSRDRVERGRPYLDGDPVTEVTSAQASAYGAALNVRQLAGGRMRTGTVIRLRNSTASEYDPSTGEIGLAAGSAFLTVAEHETVHQLMHDLTIDMPDAPNCDPHSYIYASSEICAFQEGAATALAVMAENRPGESGWHRGIMNGFIVDVETCEENGVACEDGRHVVRKVEGWVANAIWDLYDSDATTAVVASSADGLVDTSSHAAGAILDVIADGKPTDFDEFAAAWRAAHPADGDVRTFLLNKQLSAGELDESQRTGADWRSVACPCMGGSGWQFAPRLDISRGKATWDLRKAVPRTGHYDLWVNLPPGVGLDRGAVYEVIAGGIENSYTVDQSARTGWVRLTTHSVYLDPALPTTLSAESGSKPTLLAVDGVFVIPAV